MSRPDARAFGRAILSAILLGAGALASRTAQALPSYADQTGVACAQCHTAAFGPALTAYGRLFKLDGYSFSKGSASLPLAAMAVVGYNQTGADLPGAAAPHFSDNDNLAMNEFTAFFAGKLGAHAGAFVEASYSGVERNTAWGAVDVRYARSFSLAGHSIVGGITLNDNPTVTDLWGSTPVWSFPYTGSELAPTPGAAPILFDGISERVLGSTAYAMIDNHWYVEAGLYRALSDQLLGDVGLSADDNLHMRGAAPYWRAVYQWDAGADSYSAGLLGLETRLRPVRGAPARARSAAVGADATWQHTGTDHSFSANLLYVTEKRHLGASFASGESDSVSSHLDSLRLDGSYVLRQTWVASAGWFDTGGSRNAALFAPDEVDGSANGSPDSRGYTLQFEYVPFGKLQSFHQPWVNLRVGLQYTGYQKFNGGTTNYDGFGRSASDNDTLFVFLWAAL
jgi:hypothetical protein